MPTPVIYKEKIVNSEADLLEILSQISFKNSVVDFNWTFGVKEVSITDETLHEPKRGWLIWGNFERPDTNTGTVGIGRGRDEIIWEGAYESGVVKTAWVVINMLVVHELMEGFQYQGKRPFDPHNQIQALVSLQEGRTD